VATVGKKMTPVFACIIFCLSLFNIASAARTSPPAGAKVVRAGTSNSGEFATLSAAVNSLPNDGSSQTIFIYPGTYAEQVYISRSGPLTVRTQGYPALPTSPFFGFSRLTSTNQVYGYTTDTSTYKNNQVTIQAGIPASSAGSNDASGTVRIHTDDFKMYNVNVKNTYGVGGQAIALSQYGSRVGIYACGLYGYQDTLLVNDGTQVYLQGYIEVKSLTFLGMHLFSDL